MKYCLNRLRELSQFSILFCLGISISKRMVWNCFTLLLFHLIHTNIFIYLRHKNISFLPLLDPIITWVGLLIFYKSPLPNCPNSLHPQVNTFFNELRAITCLIPHSTYIIFSFNGNFSACSLGLLSPNPNCPFSFYP